MYLQRLEIQGFKSFANKTTLEFKPGITAVVGPNGSGKSNIADAVRWVLGEQSLKSLRGKKSGDVIFAGSDKKARLGFCQVDMVLNNEDGTAPVDYAEVVITRKMSRDGEGEYFINKKRVRLHDILMLLAKSNFGQRTYSIIGQGTVDQFLAATPTQRKEYFDEAAGVRQYQIKKEQAENKLNQTRENLHQAELLIQEIEPRLRSLTRQVNRLERREVVTKELKEIQGTYYTGIWHDLRSQHSTQEEQYQSTDTKRAALAKEIDTMQQGMQDLAMGSSRDDRFSQLQKEYNAIVSDKNNLARQHAELKGHIDGERTKKGEGDLVWLERRVEQLTADAKKQNDELISLRDDIEKHQRDLSDAEKELSSNASQYEAINTKLLSAKEELATKKAVTIPEIAEKVENIYARQQKLLDSIEHANGPDEIRPLLAEAKTITSQLAQLRHTLQTSGTGDPQEVIRLQDEITSLLHAKDTITNKINDNTVRVQVAKEKEALVQQQSEALTADKERAERDLARSDKSPEALAADIANEKQEIESKLDKLDSRLEEINKELSSFNQTEQEKKEEVFSLQEQMSKKQEELNGITGTLNGISVELAKLETRQEDLEKEMVDELTDEERDAIYKAKDIPKAKTELFTEIQKLKRQLELIGGIDPQVAEEYKETHERYEFLTTQSADLNHAIIDLEKAIAELNETIKKQFSKSFDKINRQFTEYFKILFKGGNASLSLVKEEVRIAVDDEDEDEDEDEGDEEEEAVEEKEQKTKGTGERVITGIDIHATPPGKRLKGISMLSGGERALTSIALLSAIIHNNPSPFVILDEVDAALDESNSIRFASIIDRLAHKTQFIVVTHNRATMNKSKILYGVTMGDDGISKLLSMNMEEAENVIGQQ